MDLSALRQQILLSNKTASEKADTFLLKSQVNDLSKDEWRNLIAGIPEDVEKAIGMLKSAVVIVEDTSEMQCEAMLQPTLPALPLSADQLEAILFAQPFHAMPVQQDVFQSFGSSPVKQMFVVDDGSAVTLARIISTQLTFRLLLGGEPDTAYNVNSSLITPLFHLDNLANNSCQGFLPVRDKGDPDSTMTLLSGKSASLRPDGIIRSTDGRRLLMKWEEKADVLADAVEDLKVKTAQWSKLYYGQLPYLLTFAAAKTHIQFYIIERGNVAQPKAVGPKILLETMSGRAKALLAAVNLHRILRTVENYLPQEVLPVDKLQVSCNPQGYIRELVFRSDLRVHKVIKGWSNFQAAWFTDISLLAKVYKATRESAGIVHAIEGPVVHKSDPRSTRRKRSLSVSNDADDHYSVVMQPVGLRGADAIPEDEAQLARAAHGFLHGLEALHKANFVHRDLRWANVACTTERAYFLLDLETCHWADQTPQIHLHIWEGLLQDSKYTKASDICLLGRMLCGLHAMQQPLTPDGMAFKHLISQPVGQALTAAQLLSHCWIACQGLDCRVAGAQPNEHHVG
ncbi:TPA: hypothetical protein ACH3X1_011852 [Trebouxia sp. C0004]